MPKQKYWTNERLYRGLLGIAQLDELPSQLSKTDAQRPPEAYLGAAVAAIGEGSTPSGFVQQLTHESDLGNAVVGGFEPLLQKMADLVEHLPIVVMTRSESMAPFVFASIVLVAMNSTIHFCNPRQHSSHLIIIFC